jgi:transglutaminase-like putative cysteine protease
MKLAHHEAAEHTGLPSKSLGWLLASFAVLIVPQWDRLPWWLLGACAVLAGWRWLAQTGRLRSPGKWLRSGVMLGMVVIYILTVDGRFTVETAASFFVLSVGLKWLETRSIRDFYVLFFILVYLATVNFLFHQDILWSLVTLSGVALLLVGLQSVNAPDLPPAFRSGWRRLGLTLLKVLPVVALLFVFFPRMAPLWSVPMVSGEARTGLSDTMTPGDISSLARSDETAFRATFGGAMPPHAERYWRGLILDRLDGETWRQGWGQSFRRPGKVAVDGGVGPLQPDEYDVLLEPTDQDWAFALDGSAAVSDNVVPVDNNLFRFRRPADTTVRYRMALVGDLPQQEGGGLSAQEQQRYLQLPVSGNPRARELAESLREQAGRPADVVNAIRARFHQQPYRYTLRPPAMPDNGVDALLFEYREGFCAHYAGAAAFLLRAAGVPARIVAGYQGGEPGAGGEYLIVRQYDAHAWVEVWLPGHGWSRFDPTAAIAPERIESGLREAMGEEGSFLEGNWASPRRYGDMAALQWVSLQMDRLNYQWQRWVVGYQGQSQMNLMSRLPGNPGLQELGYMTAGILAIGLLVAGIRLRPAIERKDPYRRILERWYRLCQRESIPVRNGETPAQLARRIARCRPDAAASASAFAGTINRYYYGGRTGPADYARLRRLLGTMKKQMANGRKTPTPERYARE